MKIVVCPLRDIDRAIHLWRPSHVIGMTSPGADVASFPDGVASLQLAFHDIAEPRDGFTLASRDDMARILTFMQTWSGGSPLIVQCWAGVSRSPAIAYVIACALSAAGREGELAGHLRAAAPFATPNPWLIALADDALKRRGAMSAAISGIGRGEEIAMGRSFEFDPLHPSRAGSIPAARVGHL